jgi:hypothetical protein
MYEDDIALDETMRYRNWPRLVTVANLREREIRRICQRHCQINVVEGALKEAKAAVWRYLLLAFPTQMSRRVAVAHRG